MVKMETSPQIDLKEQLKSSLTNLFEVPTLGIERSFGFILDLLEKQQDEHYKLQLAYEDLERQNKTYVMNFKKEIEMSNEVFHQKHEKEIENLKDSFDDMKRERDQLLKLTEKMRSEHQIFGKKLGNMDEELKVSFINYLFKSF